jgi:hypothetical protein
MLSSTVGLLRQLVETHETPYRERPRGRTHEESVGGVGAGSDDVDVRSI